MKSYYDEILDFFKGQNVLSIDKVEWWLLKYSDFYKKEYDFFYSLYIHKMDDGSTVRLPPFGEVSTLEHFLNLYDALNTITQLHRKEKYFEEEITHYMRIKNSPIELKKWVEKNEYIGSKEYVTFILDYLDYSENAYHLSVFVIDQKKLEICIDRQYFKSTIKFIDIFNKLFWEQKVLPEGLERIQKEIDSDDRVIKPPKNID